MGLLAFPPPPWPPHRVKYSSVLKCLMARGKRGDEGSEGRERDFPAKLPSLRPPTPAGLINSA
jgi:hypothetical protein